MNYVKKLNLHWFCTQNHILEPFSVRRACTKSYVTSEPYPRASQIWCQNVREAWKKKVIKCRGESFARCRVIARNVEGGALPPPVFLGLKDVCAFYVCAQIFFFYENIIITVFPLNCKHHSHVHVIFFFLFLLSSKLYKMHYFNKQNCKQNKNEREKH